MNSNLLVGFQVSPLDKDGMLVVLYLCKKGYMYKVSYRIGYWIFLKLLKHGLYLSK